MKKQDPVRRAYETLPFREMTRAGMVRCCTLEQFRRAVTVAFRAIERTGQPTGQPEGQLDKQKENEK